VNQDAYETNVAEGLMEPYLPEWLSDFAIAEVLNIPVPEVRHQPLRMLWRASVVLRARQAAEAMRKDQGT